MFAQRLRLLMNEKRMSQLQLAKMAGTTEASISRYLNEQTYMPNLNVLMKLAEGFGVSLDYLVGLTNIPTPRKTEEEFGYVLYQCYARATDRDKTIVGTVLNEYLNDEEISMGFDLT